MASKLVEILRAVMKKYSHCGLVKTNFINCWGSNPKVRNSSKLVGFSASIAVCGFAIQSTKNSEDKGNHFPSCSAGVTSKEQRLNHFSTRSYNNALQTYQRWTPQSFTSFWKIFNDFKKADISLLKLLQLLGLITPVLCTCEDSVCNCNSDSDSTENDNSQYSRGQQPSVNNACNCKSGPASNPPVSNRPCHSGSSSSCVSDIDVEALSMELGGLKQIDWVVESDLSHCHLIRQASQVTVDCVTRILTETASAYEDYQTEYRRLLDFMMDTLEDSRKACGAELEVIDCKIILIRAKMDEMKRRIVELDMFLNSLEKLGTAAAEAAFIAHAEYASIAMSERMHSMGLEIKRLRDDTKEKERDMLELQSLIIVETGKSLK